MKARLLLLAGLLGCQPPVSSGAPSRRVSLLAMNDWHAAFGERETARGAVGGLPWLAAAVDARRAVDPELLLLDAGDGFQGDPMANARLGQATVDAFALLGVDAAAVGNHEFDHGPCLPDVCTDPHPLRGAFRAAARRAPYPYLTANVTDEVGEPWAPAGVQSSVMFTRNGVTVGVFGLTTQDTPTTTRPEGVADLRFTDVVPAAARAASQLRADGAEVVVALAHVTGDCRDVPAGEACVPDGELGRLLTELPMGTLDVVIAGHAHHQMQGRVGDTVFIETGAHGAALGQVDLVVEDSGAVTVTAHPRPIWALQHAPADPWCAHDAEYPSMERAVGGVPLVPSADAVALGRVLQVWNGPGCTAVGCLKTDAVRGPLTQGGGTLGPLVSDALLAAFPDAQVAVQNAGGLRDNLSAGTVRQRDIEQVMPFRDHANQVSLSGADLLRALEVATSGAHGGLIPAGLTYTVSSGAGVDRDLDGDGQQSLWERDRLCTVRVDGVPLQPDATYSVVVSDFLLGGGDHQATGLGRGANPQPGPRVADAIRAHIASAGEGCRAVDAAVRIDVLDCDPGQ